jgi:hypothetical protein
MAGILQIWKGRFLGKTPVSRFPLWSCGWVETRRLAALRCQAARGLLYSISLVTHASLRTARWYENVVNSISSQRYPQLVARTLVNIASYCPSHQSVSLFEFVRSHDHDLQVDARPRVSKSTSKPISWSLEIKFK